jgi:hypothetical protein
MISSSVGSPVVEGTVDELVVVAVVGTRVVELEADGPVESSPEHDIAVRASVSTAAKTQPRRARRVTVAVVRSSVLMASLLARVRPSSNCHQRGRRSAAGTERRHRGRAQDRLRRSVP